MQATQNAAGAIVNKPKEMASKLISRFGSSDSLPGMKDEAEKQKDEFESELYVNLKVPATVLLVKIMKLPA